MNFREAVLLRSSGLTGRSLCTASAVGAMVFQKYSEIQECLLIAKPCSDVDNRTAMPRCTPTTLRDKAVAGLALIAKWCSGHAKHSRSTELALLSVRDQTMIRQTSKTCVPTS